jgi:hypothetical protein
MLVGLVLLEYQEVVHQEQINCQGVKLHPLIPVAELGQPHLLYQKDHPAGKDYLAEEDPR